jgi:hypothetical protein
MVLPVFVASSSTTAALNPPTISLAASKNGRVSGKAWKETKVATRRSYLSPSLKTPFEVRREADKKREAVKLLEKEMKEEKEAEAERCVSGLHGSVDARREVLEGQWHINGERGSRQLWTGAPDFLLAVNRSTFPY